MQFIEASNLDEQTSKADPIKYHAAWQALCGSQCVHQVMLGA